MLPCEQNNSSAMRCQWVNIICFFFQFLSLSWAKSTMCTHALCLLLCVVLISRRSFIKIYIEWKVGNGCIRCVPSHVQTKDAHREFTYICRCWCCFDGVFAFIMVQRNGIKTNASWRREMHVDLSQVWRDETTPTVRQQCAWLGRIDEYIGIFRFILFLTLTHALSSNAFLHIV